MAVSGAQSEWNKVVSGVLKGTVLSYCSARLPERFPYRNTRQFQLPFSVVISDFSIALLPIYDEMNVSVT